MSTTLTMSEVFEGTWDEIQQQADKFNGHRLRVTILPDGKISPLRPSSRSREEVIKRLEEAIAIGTSPATPEEIAEAARDVDEILHNLNENRKREGAEPFF